MSLRSAVKGFSSSAVKSSFELSVAKIVARIVATGCHLAVTALIVTSGIGAQETESAHCFAFAFGTWNPPLNLTTAGHEQPPPANAQLKAPGGRDWASDAMPNDTTLLLFPTWWPAGIQATLPRRPRSGADTVAGQALALVADGRVTPPRTVLRAWRVPCR